MCNNKSNKTTKKVPTSAFCGGNFKSIPEGLSGKKDKRNQVFVEGLQQGIMVAFVQKFNRAEEAYIGPHVRFLEENCDLMESLGINAIVSRKGGDGESPMMQKPGSEYIWKQFIFIIGEDGNTKENRVALGKQLAAHLNDMTKVAEDYSYPRKAKFMKDMTQAIPRPVDACLLDCDVVSLIGAAYPDLEMDEIASYPSIMLGFWANAARGAEVMEGHEEEDQEEEGQEDEWRGLKG